MLSENNPLMTMTIEEMKEKGQLRFKKNGKVDGRCVAWREKLVDEDGNDLRIKIIEDEQQIKEENVEISSNDEASNDEDDDDDDEFPSDNFFYGNLTEKITDIDTLIQIMTKGVKKYKEYMKTKENVELLPEDIVTTLDLWFQHDNERNDYFDYLISQESAPAVVFDKISVRIIQEAEDQN